MVLSKRVNQTTNQKSNIQHNFSFKLVMAKMAESAPRHMVKQQLIMPTTLTDTLKPKIITKNDSVDRSVINICKIFKAFVIVIY